VLLQCSANQRCGKAIEVLAWIVATVVLVAFAAAMAIWEAAKRAENAK
jgi:uncharacterized protein (UPF0212 family)